MKRRGMRIPFVFVASLWTVSDAWQPAVPIHRRVGAVHRPVMTSLPMNLLASKPLSSRSMSADSSTSMSQSGASSEVTASVDSVDDATRWKQEAERIRLEAARLDMRLTLSKIGSIEEKLRTRSKRLEQHPEEREQLERQLLALQQKLRGESTSETSTNSAAGPTAKTSMNTPSRPHIDRFESEERIEVQPVVSELTSTSDTTAGPDLKCNPLYGFDDEDLELYLPVAQGIEAQMPNATMNEKLDMFRSDPRLQAHFRVKIQEAVMKPMEDLQKLGALQQQYLASTSAVDKKQMKRDMEQLEKLMKEDSMYTYSDSVNMNLPPMPNEELQARLKAVGSLPPVMQALYKRAQNVEVDDSLELAILLDYYEWQLQLLEQVQEYAPLPEDMIRETKAAVETLPPMVREHLANKLGIQKDASIEKIAEALESGGYDGTDTTWTRIQNVIRKKTSDKELPTLPEYNDIDFVKRSRYVEDLYPHASRMEGEHPSSELMNELVSKFGRRTFMVTSKPERVLGGWYIRGENLISDDEGGVKLLQEVDRSVGDNLMRKLEIFYISDPSPIDDELAEMGYFNQQLFLVTARNRTRFYNNGSPLSKFLVSGLAMASTCAFGALASAQQLSIDDQTMPLLVEHTFMIVASSVAIQFSHELAHKAIALRDKIEVGLPTFVPSLNMGLLGGITPINSPPPSLRSLLDFSCAGPIAGLSTSIALLLYGLSVTAGLGTDMVAQLPALPTTLLRSSALGGGIIEFFLGKGILFETTGTSTILPLHPFAISGFVGMISNALALLPLGNTDGGRICVSLFGRQIAYVVNAFTLVLLSLCGFVGLDESNILLLYAIYCAIWQKALEGPARNEVQFIDLGRSGLALALALLVAVALAPLPT